MPSINCEIDLILTWSEDCVISSATGATKFKKADAKLYIPVVTLSTQDNAKLLQQLKSGLKRTINWNKYQTKVSTQRQNQYLDFLIDPSFQGVNRLFVLSFENEGDRKVHTGYYLPKVEIKDHNIMIDRQNFFDQPVKLIWEHMIIFEKLQQVKEMISQLVVCCTIFISKTIIR